MSFASGKSMMAASGHTSRTFSKVRFCAAVGGKADTSQQWPNVTILSMHALVQTKTPGTNPGVSHSKFLEKSQ